MFERRNWRRVSPKRILIRYMVATGLLAAAILGGYTKSMISVKKGLLYEEIINIAGRQRMLSQRIVLVAMRYSETRNPAYLTELDRGIGTFLTSHEWLLERVEEGSTIWAHYFDPSGARLDKRSRRFAELAATFLDSSGPLSAQNAGNILPQLEAMALQSLLADLDRTVKLFEEAANQRSADRELTRFLTITVALILILSKALLLFYPAHRQLEGMIERLRTQAEVDALTGLANRRHFMAEAQRLLAEHADEPERLVLIAMDLDGFKHINDTLGHPAGDTVLRSVASRLEWLTSDFSGLDEVLLARPGGDEFLALVVIAKGATAMGAARALSSAIIAEVERPVEVPMGDGKQQECHVGASLGVAHACRDIAVVDTLLANADIALYASKHAGKGHATEFSTAMRHDSERRNRWALEIKRGLQEFEFKPFFQPQVEISTGRVVGLEALARWEHPKHGLISPAEFVEQVDQAYKTDALDGQIILQAIEALRRCRDNDLFVERMSVNVSGLSLSDPDFAQSFAALARAHDLRPQDFAVEILETIVMDAGQGAALAAVQRLKRAGFAVAVDDFGTGYSSLESVALISGSILKLDRSLVSQMHEARIGKILEAAVAMGHGLDSQVYAEGVESAEHLQRLSALGVDVAQGYLIGPAMCLDDTFAWLALLPKAPGGLGRIWSGPPGPDHLAPKPPGLSAAE